MESVTYKIKDDTWDKTRDSIHHRVRRFWDQIDNQIWDPNWIITGLQVRDHIKNQVYANLANKEKQ